MLLCKDDIKSARRLDKVCGEFFAVFKKSSRFSNEGVLAVLGRATNGSILYLQVHYLGSVIVGSCTPCSALQTQHGVICNSALDVL